MKKKSALSEQMEMLSLMERMDKHLTLMEAEQYKLSCPDELMEFMWLKPNVTHLNVDIFVDDGGSYERNGHSLLLFVRNGYTKASNEFIPISVSYQPMVLDDEMEFNVTYEDIFNVYDFIQNNVSNLIALSKQEISQEDFVNQIRTPLRQVVENRELVMEMATLKASESHLPVDIWLDENGTYQGHAPRIKFKASNEQHTTKEFFLNVDN